MASLQVRELPEQIYEKLKLEAAKKHRSLAQQAVITLAKGLDSPIDPKERRRIILEELEDDKLNSKMEKLSDPVRLIREDRER
jgi:plasmid stability protein